MTYIPSNGETLRDAVFESLETQNGIEPAIIIPNGVELTLENVLLKGPGNHIEMARDARLVGSNIISLGTPGYKAGVQQGRFIDAVAGTALGRGIAAIEVYNSVMRGTAGIRLRGMLDGFVRLQKNICYHVNGREFDGTGLYQEPTPGNAINRQFVGLRESENINGEINDNAVIQHSLPYYPSVAAELIELMQDHYTADTITWLNRSEDMINLNVRGLANKFLQVWANLIIGSYYQKSDQALPYSTNTTGIIMDGGRTNHCDYLDISRNTIINPSNVCLSAHIGRDNEQLGINILENILMTSGVLPGMDPFTDDWAAYNKYSSTALSVQFYPFDNLNVQDNGCAGINTRQNSGKTGPTGTYLDKIFRRDWNMKTHPEFDPDQTPGATNYRLINADEIFYRDAELVRILNHLNRWKDAGVDVGLSNESIQVEYKNAADEAAAEIRLDSINKNQFLPVALRDDSGDLTLSGLNEDENYLFRYRKNCADAPGAWSAIQNVGV